MKELTGKETRTISGIGNIALYFSACPDYISDDYCEKIENGTMWLNVELDHDEKTAMWSFEESNNSHTSWQDDYEGCLSFFEEEEEEEEEEEPETKKEESICKIADELQEDQLYIAILKDGEKIRVKRNYNEDIENHTTGVLTTWRFYEDEYPDFNIEEWGYQNINTYITAFEKLSE